MVNDRFTGKLERYISKAVFKAQENTEIYNFIMEGEAVSDATMKDVYNTSAKLDEIVEELSNVDQLVRCMTSLEVEGQASQD